MRRIIAGLVLICMFAAFAGCSQNLTEKSEIISLFQKNEEVFLQAANSGDYSSIERIWGVQSVYISERYVKIDCGGAGFGPGTHYYGIFYSANDDLCAVDVAGSKDQLVEYDEGSTEVKIIEQI